MSYIKDKSWPVCTNPKPGEAHDATTILCTKPYKATLVADKA